MSTYDEFHAARTAMVRHILKPNGIHDGRVLWAMQSVPRHLFVPRMHRPRAYEDVMIPLAQGQSMLSPVLVATMLQALSLSGVEDVLEVGTGSGYITALMVALGVYVFSLERLPALADRAGERLYRLGFHNADIHIGDGSMGLPDMAPFDCILVNGVLPRVPRILSRQLHPQDGRMVLAVGDHAPYPLRRVRRDGDRFFARTLQAVQMPRMRGRFGFPPLNEGGVGAS